MELFRRDPAGVLGIGGAGKCVVPALPPLHHIGGNGHGLALGLAQHLLAALHAGSGHVDPEINPVEKALSDGPVKHGFREGRILGLILVLTQQLHAPRGQRNRLGTLKRACQQHFQAPFVFLLGVVIGRTMSRSSRDPEHAFQILELERIEVLLPLDLVQLAVEDGQQAQNLVLPDLMGLGKGHNETVIFLRNIEEYVVFARGLLRPGR